MHWSLWLVIKRKWEGFSYLGRVINRKSWVVLGREALNKVCSSKTICTNTIESVFTFLGWKPLRCKWRCTELGYQSFMFFAAIWFNSCDLLIFFKHVIHIVPNIVSNICTAKNMISIGIRAGNLFYLGELQEYFLFKWTILINKD